MSFWWLLLLTTGLATKIALLWQAKAKPGFGNDVAKELSQFLKRESGSSNEVRAFEQQFVGDLEDILDFVPQVVLDYSEDLFNLAANARALASKTLFLYSNDDLKVPQPQAKPLRENKAHVWSTLASSLAKHFGWDEAILLIDWPNLRAVLNTFVEPFTEQLTVSEGLEQGVYDLLATREIRRSGVHAVFLMTSAAITEAMLRAFTKYAMDKGYAFVLLGSHQFDVSLYPTGVLSLALAGSEGAKSPVEVDFWYLLYAITSRPLDQWNIVNTVQGKQHTLGVFDKGNLTISPLLYFPRGMTTPPQNVPFELFFNLNNWNDIQTFNPQRAVPLALKDFKLSTRRFEVIPMEVESCGVFSEEEGYLPCYIAVKTNQISMLLSSDVTITPIYQNFFMRASGLLIPFSSGCIASHLTSRSDFPNFLRIFQDENLVSPQLGLLARKLQYSQFTLIYNIVLGENAYKVAREFFERTGIEIINDESLILIDYSDPEYFTKVAQFLKESELRPVILIADTKDFFMLTSAFEQAGLKDEDLVISAWMTGYLDIINDSSADEIEVINKYLKSFLFSDYATYVGTAGQLLKDKILSAFGVVASQDCFSYDMTQHTVLAFEFMIKRGLDFYDWKDVIFALRTIRFNGCTGRIQFSEDDNNRSSIDFDHTQCRSVDGKIEEVKVLRTSLTGNSYFKYNDFEWFDSTSKTPKQTRLNQKDCPFPEEYRQDSDQSIDLTIALNWAAVGLCVVVNVATYFIFIKGVPFLENDEAVTLSTQDHIVLASTLIEPLVFDLVSPGINVYALIIGKSIDSRFDWSDGKYFSLLNWIYALAGVALATTTISAFNKFKPLVIDLQLLAAFIVRSLFFVFAFILLSTLDCNESQTADDLELSDAFMDVDCYQQCWTGDHKKYAIVSVVVLAGLVVLCSTLSSQLTNSLEGLQVYVNPTTELVRLYFLLIFIALHKSSARMSTTAHYSLYIVNLAIYSAVSIKLRVLSIPSLRIKYNSLLTLLLLMNICEVLHSEVYSNAILWICLCTGIGLGVLGLGLYLQSKLPKLIKSPPKIDKEALFKFAFKPNQVFRRVPPPVDISQAVGEKTSQG
jgi:hypothetical protein